jgi:hypothetical protein
MQLDAEPDNVLRVIKRWIDRHTNLGKVKLTNEQIIVCVKDQSAGDKWIELRVDHIENVTHLSQTVFFSPRGLPGFLYWYLLYPFHIMEYRGLIQSIAQQSQT